MPLPHSPALHELRYCAGCASSGNVLQIGPAQTVHDPYIISHPLELSTITVVLALLCIMPILHIMLASRLVVALAMLGRGSYCVTQFTDLRALQCTTREE